MRILTFVAAMLLALGPAAQAQANEECGAIISARCEACHYKSRICQNLGKKSARGWQRTMRNMVRHGAKITEAERKTLIECLANAAPGADFACKYKEKE